VIDNLENESRLQAAVGSSDAEMTIKVDENRSTTNHNEMIANAVHMLTSSQGVLSQNLHN
jgi:hypothetical protein